MSFQYIFHVHLFPLNWPKRRTLIKIPIISSHWLSIRKQKLIGKTLLRWINCYPLNGILRLATKIEYLRSLLYVSMFYLNQYSKLKVFPSYGNEIGLVSKCYWSARVSRKLKCNHLLCCYRSFLKISFAIQSILKVTWSRAGAMTVIRSMNERLTSIARNILYYYCGSPCGWLAMPFRKDRSPERATRRRRIS